LVSGVVALGVDAGREHGSRGQSAQTAARIVSMDARKRLALACCRFAG
jgi:hypothetical protein